MKVRFVLLAAALTMPAMAQAGSQSSNTSSNSSSNNGVVRERIADSYCVDDRCWRSVDRRVYRDGGRHYRDDRRYRANRYRDDYRRWQRYRNDDDDDD